MYTVTSKESQCTVTKYTLVAFCHKFTFTVCTHDCIYIHKYTVSVHIYTVTNVTDAVTAVTSIQSNCTVTRIQYIQWNSWRD